MTVANKQLAALRLFNEKTAELMELSFVQSLADPEAGFAIGIQRQEDGRYEVTSSVNGPTTEAVKAFVLTYRFFIQDNETTSFRNIARLYATADIDTELKDRFLSARSAINEMLDSPINLDFTYNGKRPTNRILMDVFIYGGLAHANPQKYETYKEWMGHPISNAIFRSSFTIVLGHVLNAIVYIARVNLMAIEQIERKVES